MNVLKYIEGMMEYLQPDQVQMLQNEAGKVLDPMIIELIGRARTALLDRELPRLVSLLLRFDPELAEMARDPGVREAIINDVERVLNEFIGVLDARLEGLLDALVEGQLL